MIKAKNGNKLDLIDYLFLLIIAYNISPFVSRLISSTVTTYFYLGVIVVAILFVLAKNKGRSLEGYLIFLIPFILWKIWIFFTSSTDTVMFVYGILLDFAPLIIGLYITAERNKKVTAFVWTIVIFIVVTMITSIIFLQESPNASRILATALESDNELIIEYNWKNIGGYSFVYLAVLLYPVLILATKKGYVKWWISLILSLLLLVYIFYSGYTIAFLLFLISSVLWLMKRDLNSRDIVIIILAAVFVMVFFYTVLSDFFNWLADVINSEEISPRLRALAGGYEGLENFEDRRIDLYRTSLNTFLSSPLFGTVFERGSIGGHSFILDFMAQYGLIGLTILVYIYYNIYKYFFARYKKYSGYGYVIWTFAQVLLLSFFNTGMWLFVLSFFAPVLFKFIFSEGKGENTLGR